MSDNLKDVLEHIGHVAGRTLGCERFDTRLRTQKVVYLLKDLGLPAARTFTYGSYIRGPYSPALAEVYYSWGELERRARPGALPDAMTEVVVDAVRRGNEFLEAVTTLLMVGRANPRARAERVRVHVQRMKPKIADRIAGAWDWLVARGLLDESRA